MENQKFAISINRQPKEDKKSEIKIPVQYVFINKSLNLNPGKMAAQVAHAQEELFSEIFRYEEKLNTYKEIINQNPRTTIILEAKDTEQLYKIISYLESCDILVGIYVDEKGKDYLLEPTAFVTEYLDKSDPRIESIFKIFDLYKYVSNEEINYLSKLQLLKQFVEEDSYWLSNKQFRQQIFEQVKSWKL